MRFAKLGAGYNCAWGIGDQAGMLMISNPANTVVFNGAVGSLIDIDQVMLVGTNVYVFGPTGITETDDNYGIARINSANWTVDENCAAPAENRMCAKLLGASYFAIWNYTKLLIVDLSLDPKFNGTVASTISKIEDVFLDDDADIKVVGYVTDVADSTYGLGNITVSNWTYQATRGR